MKNSVTEFISDFNIQSNKVEIKSKTYDIEFSLPNNLSIKKKGKTLPGNPTLHLISVKKNKNYPFRTYRFNPNSEFAIQELKKLLLIEVDMCRIVPDRTQLQVRTQEPQKGPMSEFFLQKGQRRKGTN